MRRTHRLPQRLVRWTSLFVSSTLLLSAFAILPSQATSKRPAVKSNDRSDKTTAPETQGRRMSPVNDGKKVAPAPPQAGAPAMNLPNIDELKHRRPEAPRAPEPVPSTMRSRRKPLEPPKRRKPGERLPPGWKVSSYRTGSGSDRVSIAGTGALNKNRTPVRPHHARATRSLSFLATLMPQGGSAQNVTWTNVVGVAVSGNSLTKTAATGWGNAGAASTKSIASGDGYVEFTVASLYTGMVALSHTDTNQDYTSMEFALLPNSDGNLYVFESGANRGVVSTYTTADVFRVAVEGGVVKYRKNGTLVYTSTVAPTYPLLVDAGLYHNGGTQANVVISGNLDGGTFGDQYIQNFIQMGLARQPHSDELSYWGDIMRAAYPQGESSRLLAMHELGRSVFESAEYIARNRSNHDYVYDLYKTYLMREPDAEGWAFWTNDLDHSQAPAPAARENLRRWAFEDSLEFHNLIPLLIVNGAPSSAVSSLATARVDPFNQTGNQLQARDGEWSLPLLSLPGRAGLDLGLGLSYSSLVWTKSGPYVYFDEDSGSPSPGFRLGFPTIQGLFFDARVGRNVYMLITSSGRRVELRQTGSSNIYEAGDSSYLQLIDYGWLLLRNSDGTVMGYSQFGDEWHCTGIEDRNGNYLVVNNDWRGDIQNITDTLGRAITFNYDGNSNLNTITQTWTVNGVAQAHTWATFVWGEPLTLHPNISGVVGTHDGDAIPVIRQVVLDDGSRYTFPYNGNGQVNAIGHYSGNLGLSYTAYDYDSSTTACPRLSAARVWGENWNGDVDGVPAPAEEAVTHFSDPGDGTHVMTMPDSTVYKEFYGGTGASPAWQHGLVTSTQVLTGSTIQKTTTIAYTQDNTSVNYQTNPRIIQTDINDAAYNHRRTTIDYGAYAQYGLPQIVTEYGNGPTELRHTYIQYNLNQPYLDRRIIGLPSLVIVGDTSQFYAWTTYGYDESNLDSQAATATMHDANNYPASMSTRGNLTAVSRYDVNYPGDASKALTTQMTYNAAGSLLSTTDPAMHTSSLSYLDNFAPDGHSQNTFAYPSSITDADQHSTVVQYNYDFGAKTVIIGPPPANQPNGVIQTFSYDDAARLQWATTLNTGASIQYIYGEFYVLTFSSVNSAGDNFGFTFLNGVGGVYATLSDHPGTGHYRAQITRQDAINRVTSQSNPTEVTGSWVPSGDDAYNQATDQGGWIYTQQTYDWKGRPLETTHLTDGTVKYASYSGCGCAGGEVVTLTDEVGRQQKVYSDVLGRQWKTEIMDGNSIYSTTETTLNARDQVTLVRQFQGNDQSGLYQDTTISYDGYGRLQSKHVPEQNAGTATVYAYNPDDTVQSVTDARGAVTSYIYNNGRHLVNEIQYSAPSGVMPTSNVSFGYDAAGNRTSMSDGLGSQSYSYNQLSQLQSETRTFNGVGTFTLSYDYNLAGELKKITDSTNMTINYGYDSTGRLNGVTGSDNLYAGVSNYASNFQYRAWGGLKAMTDGSNHTSSLSYNSKLQPSQFDISSGVVHQNYDYHNDGRISFVHNTTDANFDRSYSYDHAARLTQATTGGTARGDSASTPYHETFGYDALSNLTSRFSSSWSQDEFSDGAIYANNRRAGWGYDADGRNTTIDTRTYTFDAAGRQTLMTGQKWAVNHYVASNIATNYDADGASIKNVADGITTYFLRSSVLGGAIIEELNSSGQKNAGYVYYAGGRELATQTNNEVIWKHSTPANTSKHEIHSANGFAGRIEFDPVGADVKLEAPLTPDPASGQGDVDARHVAALMDSKYAALNNPASGCVVDGFETSCANAMTHVNFGTGNSTGFVNNGSVTMHDLAHSVMLSASPQEIFAPAGNSIAGITPGVGDSSASKLISGGYAIQDPVTGNWSGEMTIAPAMVTGLSSGVLSFASSMQNRGAVPFPGTDAIKQRLNTGDCNAYIGSLIAKAGEKYGGGGNVPVAKDGLDLLSKISSQGGFVLKDVLQLNGYTIGGTVSGSIAGNNTDPAGSATVLLKTRWLFDSNANAVRIYQADYVNIAIHEMLHLSGRYAGYDDTQLATAASMLPGAASGLPAPPKDNNDTLGVIRNSDYYHNELMKHCGPR